jgi:hypothetical protein
METSSTSLGLGEGGYQQTPDWKESPSPTLWRGITALPSPGKRGEGTATSADSSLWGLAKIFQIGRRLVSSCR